MSKLPTTLRLDRMLANLGYGSRREVQNMVRSGRVTFEGEPLDDPDQRLAIKPELSERMRIDGKPLDPPPGEKIARYAESHRDYGPDRD